MYAVGMPRACAVRGKGELPELGGRVAVRRPGGVRRAAAGLSVPGIRGKLASDVQASAAAQARSYPAGELAAPRFPGADVES